MECVVCEVKRMRILTIAGLALLALTGCRPKDRDFIIYEGPSFHAAHTHPVPPERALEAKNGARLEIEKRLAQAQSDSGRKAFRYVLDHWDYYVCQLIGLKKDGREIILLRFFPRGMQQEQDLTTSEVQVSDGGPDYWTIEYDVESHAYASLSVNREA
jgi:hypothetical protein